MTTHNSWRIRAALALALTLGATLALSACAGTGPGTEPSKPTELTSKEANIFAKDVNLCIENMSGRDVTIAWHPNVNSHTGSGVLPDGQTYCGEGSMATARITFWDSFTGLATGVNPAIGQPSVLFSNGNVTATYDEISFAPGESAKHSWYHHRLLITRHASDDWIQFTVSIVD